MPDNIVTYKPKCGEPLRVTAENACNLSAETGSKVKFVFNGVGVFANPDSTTDNVMQNAGLY